MNIAYLLVLAAVIGAVLFLTYVTVPQQELQDSDVEFLGEELDSADSLLVEFDSLEDMSLEEINDSLFNP